MAQSIFTHVSIKLAAGENLISASEWEAYPVSQKTKLVLSKSVTFLNHGNIVPLAQVIQALKEENQHD